MSRRGDNIRKRKDGRWEARYSYEGLGEESKKYGSVYGKTYQEAKEKRTQLLACGIKKPANRTSPSFEDVLTAWQAANCIRLKQSSTARYQALIDSHILPSLGNKHMTQITVPVLNRFLSEKLYGGRLDHTGGLSPSYVRSMASVISSAIAFGAAENMCVPLPSAIVKPPAAKKTFLILNTEQQTLLEQALMTDMNETKLLIYITLYTGIRIGEACALRWEHIDFEERVLYIKQTVSRVWVFENGRRSSRLIVDTPKTHSSLRCIPICSKLYAVLSSFSRRKKTGYISANENDLFTSPRTYEYRYKQILKSCKLEPINYHALRHTFATRCIERGVDIKSLSEILGHASVSITLNTYIHSSMELKRVQLEKLVM